jgi:hypothetical protein
MEQIIIRNPGVSSVEIQIGNRRILVDAFNKLNEPEKVMTGDILLFTHDDGITSWRKVCHNLITWMLS